jgi:hypothetical protein
MDGRPARVIGDLVRGKVESGGPLFAKGAHVSSEQLKAGFTGYAMFICRDPDELLASFDLAAVDWS